MGKWGKEKDIKKKKKAAPQNPFFSHLLNPPTSISWDSNRKLSHFSSGNGGSVVAPFSLVRRSQIPLFFSSSSSTLFSQKSVPFPTCSLPPFTRLLLRLCRPVHCRTRWQRPWSVPATERGSDRPRRPRQDHPHGSTAPPVWRRHTTRACHGLHQPRAWARYHYCFQGQCFVDEKVGQLEWNSGFLLN